MSVEKLDVLDANGLDTMLEEVFQTVEDNYPRRSELSSAIQTELNNGSFLDTYYAMGLQGIEIPANADLNSYTDPGNYIGKDLTLKPTSSLTNCPITSGKFILRVQMVGSVMSIVQELIDEYGNKWWRRGTVESLQYVFTDWNTDSKNIAPVNQNGTTASKAYSHGDLLVWRGKLYEASADITNGATLTVGTNIDVITVDGKLKDLLYLISDLVDAMDTKLSESAFNVMGAKNLIPTPYNTGHDNPITLKGVTFEYDSNGIIIVDGIHDNTGNNSSINICQRGTLPDGLLKQNVEYILSNESNETTGTFTRFIFYTKGTSTEVQVTYDIETSNGDKYTSQSATTLATLFKSKWCEWVKFKITSDLSNVYYSINVGLNKGVQATNAYIKPMLRLASIQDDTFVPYAMTNNELTERDSISVGMGTCSTAGDQQVKVVTISDPKWKLKTGSMIAVKFTNTNTYSATAENTIKLNVNNTGDKEIYYNTNATLTGSSTTVFGYANRIIYYIYDGTYWVWAGHSRDNNTEYTPQSLGNGYGTCSTAAATVAKVATLSGYALVTNGIVAVKFTNAVPASGTLNINSKGAKPIYYKGAAITAGVINAGDTATFIYDGTHYVLISIDSPDTNVDGVTIIKDSSTNEISVNQYIGTKAEVTENLSNIPDGAIVYTTDEYYSAAQTGYVLESLTPVIVTLATADGVKTLETLMIEALATLKTITAAQYDCDMLHLVSFMLPVWSTGSTSVVFPIDKNVFTASFSSIGYLAFNAFVNNSGNALFEAGHFSSSPLNAYWDTNTASTKTVISDVVTSGVVISAKFYKYVKTSSIYNITQEINSEVATNTENIAQLSSKPVLLSSGLIEDTLNYTSTGYRFLMVVVNNSGFRDTKIVSLSGADIGGAFTMAVSATTYQYITRTSCYPHGNNTLTGGNKYVYGIK